MVDIHDRKPLVLKPEVAREWINPGTTAKRAEEIAQHGCSLASEFKWHPVSKLVGNVRNQSEDLIKKISI